MQSIRRLNAVQNVRFDLQEGEILALIGPNGAGKTTTFNMIAGSLPATSGSVSFRGSDLIGMKPEQIAKQGIARTYQITAIFFGLSVFENVLIATHRLQTATILDSLFYTRRYFREERAIREKAHEILKFVGLGHLEEQTACNLAYGQQRLLEIAIALATEPTLLLLDEPAAGLNPEETVGPQRAVPQDPGLFDYNSCFRAQQGRVMDSPIESSCGTRYHDLRRPAP